MRTLGNWHPMKISMSGRYSPDEFAEAIDRVIQNFRANGADEFRSVTIYLNAYRQKRHLLLEDAQSGATLQHLQYDGPLSRPFQPISPRLRIAEEDDLGKPRK